MLLYEWNMLPVRTSPLFGWKCSFSHHCNALRHIKGDGLQCLPEETTHSAALHPAPSSSSSAEFDWTTCRTQQKPFTVLYFLQSARSPAGLQLLSLFQTCCSGVIIGHSDAQCCCRQRPLQTLMSTTQVYFIINPCELSLHTHTHTHRSLYCYPYQDFAFPFIVDSLLPKPQP